MKLTIRLDDITPGMNWNNFERMKAMLDAARIHPVIGVVPCCADPKLDIDPAREDFWEYVRKLQDQGWTVALHGWKHVYTTDKSGMFPLNRQSEFAGLSLERQTAMLAEGMEILHRHGLKTDLFMAPSHTYDRNTLRAMKQCGLVRMTDGFGRGPYRYQGITFYPISLDRGHSLGDPGEGITTLVYHCNTMSDADFRTFDRILQDHSFINYSEYLKMQPSKRSKAGQIGEYLLALAKRTAVQLRH